MPDVLNCKEMVRNSQRHMPNCERLYYCLRISGCWASPTAFCGSVRPFTAVKGLNLTEKSKAGILLDTANLQADICELCKQRSGTQACPYKQAVFSESEGMEKHSCLIIIEVGRELIPVVLLGEE